MPKMLVRCFWAFFVVLLGLFVFWFLDLFASCLFLAKITVFKSVCFSPLHNSKNSRLGQIEHNQQTENERRSIQTGRELASEHVRFCNAIFNWRCWTRNLQKIATGVSSFENFELI